MPLSSDVIIAPIFPREPCIYNLFVSSINANVHVWDRYAIAFFLGGSHSSDNKLSLCESPFCYRYVWVFVLPCIKCQVNNIKGLF